MNLPDLIGKLLADGHQLVVRLWFYGFATVRYLAVVNFTLATKHEIGQILRRYKLVNLFAFNESKSFSVSATQPGESQ